MDPENAFVVIGGTWYDLESDDFTLIGPNVILGEN